MDNIATDKKDENDGLEYTIHIELFFEYRSNGNNNT